MTSSFSGAGINIANMDKTTKEYQDLKEAYDIKMRDYSMKEAYDAGKQDGDPEYVSMADSYNPASMQKGVITTSDGRSEPFTESDSEFAARQEKAATIYANLQKVDLTWRDEKGGEESVKKYTAAKDLRDLAETKVSFAKQRDAHKDNIQKIETAKRTAN